MLGLRLSEDYNADITDIRYDSVYELLHVIGHQSREWSLRQAARQR